MNLSITIIEGNVQISAESEIRIDINGKLSYVFNVHQAKKTFTVPPSAFLRLLLADSSSGVSYGSVSISSSLFPYSDSFWLPLLSCANDLVEELPFDYLAKLWIQLSPVTESLMPILEASEKSESAEGDTDYRLQIETEKNSNLCSRIAVLESQLEDMFLHSEELSKRLNKTILENEEFDSIVKKYKKEVSLRDAKIKEQENEIKKLKIEIARNRYSSEQRLTRSTKILVPNNQRVKTPTTDLDKKIKQKLNEIGKPGLMKKEKENVYSIGKKKIIVELRGGTLIWKSDGKVKTFEELAFPRKNASRSSSNRRSQNTPANLNQTIAAPIKSKKTPAEIKNGLLTPYRERKARPH